MAAEKATPDNSAGFEIARMARLLGVSRSGYYDWARREAAGPSPAAQRRTELTSKIEVHHAESDRVYAGRRGSWPTYARPASRCPPRRSRN